MLAAKSDRWRTACAELCGRLQHSLAAASHRPSRPWRAFCAFWIVVACLACLLQAVPARTTLMESARTSQRRTSPPSAVVATCRIGMNSAGPINYKCAVQSYAGILGITRAFELAAGRHEVTVFERCGGEASETSFVDAGVVAPAYVTPWAAGGMGCKVIKHLLGQHSPVRINAKLGSGAWAWL